VPVAALGAVLGYEVNADIQQRYLDSSRTSATLIAQVGIQPLLTADEVAIGLTADQVDQVDQKLLGGSVSKQVSRIKVWNRNGTIAYSDNHELIGKTFPIDDDLAASLAGHPSASITSGSSAENKGDTLSGLYVQVYVPLVFATGFLPTGSFELYLPYAPVQAAIDRESRQLYGILAIGLALFYASMFPVVLIAERWRRRLVHEAQETALANLALLERLNKLKSEFLTRISHQFRTGLVGIQGFTEMIRDSEQLDLVEVKAFASDIYIDAERLDRAFKDMIELDAMEAGRTTLRISRATLNEVVSSAVQTARDENPSRAISERLDPSVRTVSCDRDRITQVLEILLGNAIKYSPAQGEVAVSTEAQDDFVTVTVADQGPGMPDGFDQSLFFGYGRSSAGRVNGDRTAGTGLGLPIARQIIEMHGGRIWFESSAGTGAKFHFTLPVKVRPSRELRAVSVPR
jgi:signal transduction histidine kinase